MKNNYPIKYAVMPIYEQVGWNIGLNELEKEYDAVVYIVSKCYVISDVIKYKMDGRQKKEYQVVFPYEKDEYGNWSRIEPEYHLLDKKCINYNIVNEIYDSYEDALKAAKSKNEKIKQKKISSLNSSNNLYAEIERVKIEHKKLIQRYEELQKQIEKNTYDLKIGEKAKEQSLIITSNKTNKKINMYEDKLINISLYDYINLSRYESFEVFNISLEDYELMKKQLEKNKMLDEQFLQRLSKNRLLINLNESEIIQIINSDKSYFCLNDDLYLVYNENMNIHYIEGNHIVVYTIETYEDIIKSFITKYKSEENIEIEGKTIKKKLTLR